MTDSPNLEALYRDHLEHLQRTYAAALARAGFDGLIIHSGSPHLQNHFDDQHWPLRPTPAFRHWVPLAEADCALAFLPRASQPLTLCRPTALDFWEGRAPVESEHFWQSFDLREVEQVDDLTTVLPAPGGLAFIGEDTERAAAWGFSPDSVNPRALVEALDTARTLKTAYERHCIAVASQRAARGHARVFEAFRAGDCSELELHLLYLQATDQDDAETPYKNIVAIDEHASVLHHVHYGRRVPEGPAHSLLVDAGATYLGYASDITRTAVKGSEDGADLFGALVDRVDALQQRVCSQIALDLAYEELHDQCHHLLASVLRELEIASASDEELVATGVTRTFLPHGLGHSLGIQVHDVGARSTPPRDDNPFLRATFHIAPGHLFTIEPGCYFIDGLLEKLRGTPAGRAVNWRVVDLLRKFGGVRIEDNIAVLDEGIENLTRDNWPTNS